MQSTIQQPESPNCIVLENGQFSPKFAIPSLGSVSVFSKKRLVLYHCSKPTPVHLSCHFCLFFFHLFCLFSEYRSCDFWIYTQAFYRKRQYNCEVIRIKPATSDFHYFFFNGTNSVYPYFFTGSPIFILKWGFRRKRQSWMHTSSSIIVSIFTP